jgi:hypothetical protein
MVGEPQGIIRADRDSERAPHWHPNARAATGVINAA